MFLVHFKVQSQHAFGRTEETVKITASLVAIQIRVMIRKSDTSLSVGKTCAVNG